MVHHQAGAFTNKGGIEGNDWTRGIADGGADGALVATEPTDGGDVGSVGFFYRSKHRE